MECWESTPRIAFLSPEPASGKTRALEVTEPLVPRPVHAVNTTSAYLFRKVSDPEGLPTILYDEIDTVFGPKAKDNEDIRGMLNAGHRNGAVAGRCVVRGKVIETEELPAYCAVAMAGLDDLPDTIMTRTIVMRMKKRAPSEPVKPWRQRVDGPDRARSSDSVWPTGPTVSASAPKASGPRCRRVSTTATPTPGRRCWPSPISPAGTGPTPPVSRLSRLSRIPSGRHPASACCCCATSEPSSANTTPTI